MDLLTTSNSLILERSYPANTNITTILDTYRPLMSQTSIIISIVTTPAKITVRFESNNKQVDSICVDYMDIDEPPPDHLYN